MSQIWARVKDKTTGHHYDVTLERLDLLLERGVVEEVADGEHQQRHGGKPCAPKPRRPLGVPAPQPKRTAVKAVAEPKESESS